MRDHDPEAFNNFAAALKKLIYFPNERLNEQMYNRVLPLSVQHYWGFPSAADTQADSLIRIIAINVGENEELYRRIVRHMARADKDTFAAAFESHFGELAGAARPDPSPVPERRPVHAAVAPTPTEAAGSHISDRVLARLDELMANPNREAMRNARGSLLSSAAQSSPPAGDFVLHETLPEQADTTPSTTGGRAVTLLRAWKRDSTMERALSKILNAPEWQDDIQAIRQDMKAVGIRKPDRWAVAETLATRNPACAAEIQQSDGRATEKRGRSGQYATLEPCPHIR
jgi:hypothetical protein